MRLDGLRLQLLGLFVLPLTLIVLAVAIMATGVHRRAMRALIAERDERAAASAAAAVEEALQSRISMVGILAHNAALNPPSSHLLEASQVFEAAFPRGFAAYDASGNLLLGDDLLAELEAELETFQFTDPSQILTLDMGGERIVLFTNQESEVKSLGAILLSDLILPALQPQISSPGKVSAYVVEAPHDLLLSVGGDAPANLVDHSGVQAALRGDRGSSFLPMADGEHVVAFAPIPSAGWGLIIEEPWETVTSSVLDLSLLAPFSLVPILLLVLLGLWFGARRVIEPLRRLEEASMELPTGGTEAIETPVGGIAEIEQLRASLLGMSQRVREAQSALRAYIGVITNAQEEERRRIARELHDESIQHWIALDQRLQMAVKRLRDQRHPEAELLSELHREAQGGIKELRRLSRGLRPIYLEDLGLVPAIEMLARDAEESLGLPVRIQVQGKPTRLTPESELVVYRLAQESLSNAGRHAEASSAEIRLVFGEGLLEVCVADDGQGFSPPDHLESLAAAGHYGLLGMKERADSIEGMLEIDSSPGNGTRIRLSVPTSRKPRTDD